MGSEKYQMLAKTFAGLEDVLKTELEEIGASDVEVVDRGVKFTGSKEILYRANFCCRTALRILRIIGEYKVKNANDLYQNIFKIDWSEYFNVDQTFAVISSADSDAFNSAMFVSLKTKDAILDQFRNKMGKRPFLNVENPEIRITVHASIDEFTVSLDSSGESLQKRGYKVGQNDASLSEILAAGILKLAGWKGQCDFYDGMCGSGTIPVEAALIARNIPPGIFRKSFAFESWKDFDSELFEAVYNDDYEVPFEHTIYASDISAMSVKVAEKNARSAGLKTEIDFKTLDFATLKPTNKNSLLIINPTLGERMNDRKVEPLYNTIGDSLKRNFAGCKAWILSSADDGFKTIGLRPSDKISLYNANVECCLRFYELFDGSQRVFQERSTNREENTDRRSSFNSDRPTDSRSDRRGDSFKPDRGRGDFKSDRRQSDFGAEKRNDVPRGARRSDDSRPDRRSENSNVVRKFDAPRDERKGGDFRPERRSVDSSNGRRSEAPRSGERRGGDFRPDRRNSDSRPERRNEGRPDRKGDKFSAPAQASTFKSEQAGSDFVQRRPVKDTFVEILSTELKHTDRKGVFQPKEKPEKLKDENVSGKVKRRRIKDAD